METRTLTHEVYFAATTEEVFEVMVDSKLHSEFTGAPANIEPKQGGKFTLYNGEITGMIVELKPNQRLVQDWRAKNWPAPSTCWRPVSIRRTCRAIRWQ